jgi:MFS family permease
MVFFFLILGAIIGLPIATVILINLAWSGSLWVVIALIGVFCADVVLVSFLVYTFRYRTELSRGINLIRNVTYLLQQRGRYDGPRTEQLVEKLTMDPAEFMRLY